MPNIYEIGSEDFASFGSLENQQGLEGLLLLKNKHN
jgi:hypothetical protein